MQMPDLQCGTYQHYKNGKFYQVIAIALHTETKEELVVYKAMDDSQIWVRPKMMFMEKVEHLGLQVSRFKWIES